MMIWKPKRVSLKRIVYFIILVVILKAGKTMFILFSESDGDHFSTIEFTSEEDRSWLRNLATSRSDEIPTVVVEEHFEVLQYWFQAAELGFIPKSKNVLIHIDTHADGTIPYNVEVIPWFHPPKDHEQVFMMMQRNDMFIVAATLTGFIDHIIWVWPTWDDHSEDETELMFDVEIGLAEQLSEDGQTFKIQNVLCFCWAWSDSSEEQQSEDRWRCHIRNNNCVEHDECPVLERDKCAIQSQIVLEVVGESRASSILSQYKWPTEKGLILDIDEDYFGCWSDVINLYEAGITQRDIDALSDTVASLFCGVTADEEALGDQIYSAIISFIKNLKFRGCVSQDGVERNDECLGFIDIDDFLVQNDEDIFSLIKSQQSVSVVLCNPDDGNLVRFNFQNLLRDLLNFSIEQLELLQQLGICLGVSPSSPNFPDEGQFHLCHGDNIPNQTLVAFHLPTEDEIHLRSVEQNKIITSVSKKPNIISICRSVRDGYTPKLFSSFIESRILNSVSSFYRSMNMDNVYDDSNLLGGKDGWNGRSKPLVPQFLKLLRYYL